jgi:hypothetical protein
MPTDPAFTTRLARTAERCSFHNPATNGKSSGQNNKKAPINFPARKFSEFKQQAGTEAPVKVLFGEQKCFFSITFSYVS